MKRALILVVAALFGTLAVAGSADAHGGGRVRFGVVIGGPLWWGWHHPYYYPPYSERVIIERPGPTVYVEKDADGVERDADQYWYYCPDSETYYPYVKKCASPWHRVAPQPAQ